MSWQSLGNYFVRLGAWLRRANTLAGDLVAAIWLIAWFVVCLTLIVFTMAAQQFQTQIAGTLTAAGTTTSGADSPKTTVGFVLDKVDDLDRVRAGEKVAQKKLYEAEANASKSESAIRAAQLTASDARSALTAKLSQLFARLLILPPAIGNGFGQKDFQNSVAGAQDAEFGATRYLSKNRLPPQDPSDVPLRTLLNDSRADLDKLQDAVDKLNVAWEVNAEDVQTVDTRRKEIAAWQVREKVPDNLEQPVDDLARYKGILWGWPFAFVALPGIVLTLLLTVLMGVLGALIALTRELVFEEKDHPAGQYLFRIGLGASVALAVFFFAGAGVLTLAQTNASGTGKVELSPYLVSFFGIVSGYLSRRVTQWMRETGARIFLVKEDADRWAVDLDHWLKDKSSDAATLAKAINVDPQKMGLWIARSEAVPYMAQLQIAAFLQMPAFRLFSDIPPPP
jgi:hypothetical protein